MVPNVQCIETAISVSVTLPMQKSLITSFAVCASHSTFYNKTKESRQVREMIPINSL